MWLYLCRGCLSTARVAHASDGALGFLAFGGGIAFELLPPGACVLSDTRNRFLRPLSRGLRDRADAFISTQSPAVAGALPPRTFRAE